MMYYKFCLCVRFIDSLSSIKTPRFLTTDDLITSELPTVIEEEIPLHSKRDLEKTDTQNAGCLAEDTEFEVGYAATQKTKNPGSQTVRERAPHLQILSFIHSRKETHFSSLHSFHKQKYNYDNINTISLEGLHAKRAYVGFWPIFIFSN